MQLYFLAPKYSLICELLVSIVYSNLLLTRTDGGKVRLLVDLNEKNQKVLSRHC